MILEKYRSGTTGGRVEPDYLVATGANAKEWALEFKKPVISFKYSSPEKYEELNEKRTQSLLDEREEKRERRVGDIVLQAQKTIERCRQEKENKIESVYVQEKENIAESPETKETEDRNESLDAQEIENIIGSANTQETSLWMDRYRNWYDEINRLSGKAKEQVIKMQSDIIQLIKGIMKGKEQKTKNTEQNYDDNEIE